MDGRSHPDADQHRILVVIAKKLTRSRFINAPWTCVEHPHFGSRYMEEGSCFRDKTVAGRLHLFFQFRRQGRFDLKREGMQPVVFGNEQCFHLIATVVFRTPYDNPRSGIGNHFFISVQCEYSGRLTRFGIISFLCRSEGHLNAVNFFIEYIV